MGQVKVILPAMGEGIFEATIIQWLLNEGDVVHEDAAIVEIATDKVDSEVPSPANGILQKILVPVGELAKVGQAIALILTDAELENVKPTDEQVASKHTEKIEPAGQNKISKPSFVQIAAEKPYIPFKLSNGKFLSPLVRNIADKENISSFELESITGSGVDNRITKEDILIYLANKKAKSSNITTSFIAESDNVEIIEMNRVRKLIATHMLASKQTAPHVTSFHEVDVTTIVKWREINKDEFLKRHGQKLTYTPIFIDAVAKAIMKFPLINISVDGDRILKKKQINIGMATALPDGNLIVPVIHQTNALSPVKLTEKVNDLANRARNKQLQPHETQGGTFTITNVGAFGNLSGTPIINLPEAAILAIGTIKKRPAVIETPEGDLIGIRHQMILSLSYDHRVIDGSLGGMFLKQIADNMEFFDGNKWL